MAKLASLGVAVAVLSITVSARNTSRYFKENHLTGATYIALAGDGTYTVTGREDVGISVDETGGWNKPGSSIKFTPDKHGKPAYQAVEITYRGHTFLALQDDSGPSIAISVLQVEHDVDKNPKTLPPYVFFKVSAAVYHRETNLSKPLLPNQQHTLRW